MLVHVNLVAPALTLDSDSLSLRACNLVALVRCLERLWVDTVCDAASIRRLACVSRINRLFRGRVVAISTRFVRNQCLHPQSENVGARNPCDQEEVCALGPHQASKLSASSVSEGNVSKRFRQTCSCVLLSASHGRSLTRCGPQNALCTCKSASQEHIV